MKPLFTVCVRITDTHFLKSRAGEINMIVFDGTCEAPFFKGYILSGACDTQKYIIGHRGMLSARYMLEGEDEYGQPARIFIENNACLSDDGQWKTTPVIYTDSPALSWLEKERLTGEIEGKEDGVLIHFYREDDI